MLAKTAVWVEPESKNTISDKNKHQSSYSIHHSYNLQTQRGQVEITIHTPRTLDVLSQKTRFTKKLQFR